MVDGKLWASSVAPAATMMLPRTWIAAFWATEQSPVTVRLA